MRKNLVSIYTYVDSTHGSQPLDLILRYFINITTTQPFTLILFSERTLSTCSSLTCQQKAWVPSEEYLVILYVLRRKLLRVDG